MRPPAIEKCGFTKHQITLLNCSKPISSLPIWQAARSLCRRRYCRFHPGKRLELPELGSGTFAGACRTGCRKNGPGFQYPLGFLPPDQ